MDGCLMFKYVPVYMFYMHGRLVLIYVICIDGCLLFICVPVNEACTDGRLLFVYVPA